MGVSIRKLKKIYRADPPVGVLLVYEKIIHSKIVNMFIAHIKTDERTVVSKTKTDEQGEGKGNTKEGKEISFTGSSVFHPESQSCLQHFG